MLLFKIKQDLTDAITQFALKKAIKKNFGANVNFKEFTAVQDDEGYLEGEVNFHYKIKVSDLMASMNKFI